MNIHSVSLQAKLDMKLGLSLAITKDEEVVEKHLTLWRILAQGPALDSPNAKKYLQSILFCLPYIFLFAYCQAQPKPKFNWAELALLSLFPNF